MESADVIELRLDRFSSFDFAAVRTWLNKPLIATFRSPNEGGYWTGDSERLVKLLQAAIDAGFEYIDVEWKQANSILPRLDLGPVTRVILSHHSQTSRFTELQAVLKEMFRIPASIYKLVFPAVSLDDNLTALRLIDEAREQNKKFIIHASGEAGKLSRLAGALRGNEFTYTALHPNRQTAPGQLTLDETHAIYHLHEKTADTRLVGLLGYPVSQSLGWKLHNILLGRLKKTLPHPEKLSDFLYVNFPAEDFDSFWKNWQSRVDALSITIPYKERMAECIELPSPSVEETGVCNTAVRREGSWFGFNTDFLALAELFRPHVPRLRKGVLVIGTGATTRSAIVALKQLGVTHIQVQGRNEARGKLLQKIYQISYENDINKVDEKITAIIQTTPVGMYPQVEALPPGHHLFRKGMVVMDVIFNPQETRFLRLAREAGCQVISGEKMYVRQAAKQFEIFSGMPVSPEEVRRVWELIQQEETGGKKQ
ncbi:MAG: type I 3-dehydroquinate dehydratase [Calditrichia bacterium]